MRVPLWDLPVRTFHWLLAILVVVSFVTGHLGGDWLAWHFRSGYTILTLVVFRVAWGFVGSETARFTQFLRGPGAGVAYARETFAGRRPSVLGHNPLGGWMVLLLLAVVLAQAATGLFTDDEISTRGPLAVTVSDAVVGKLGAFHHVNQWVLVAAVVLHVAAIFVYRRWLTADLVGPMWHGMTEIAPGVAPPRQVSLVRAICVVLAAAAFVYWLVIVYPGTGA